MNMRKLKRSSDIGYSCADLDQRLRAVEAEVSSLKSRLGRLETR